MIRPVFAVTVLAMAAPALAQQPVNLIPPSPAREAPSLALPLQNEAPPVPEPAPNFQPVRPAEPDPEPTRSEPVPAPAPAPVPAPMPVAEPAPAPVAPPAAPAPAPIDTMPGWAIAILIISGAVLAGLFGMLGASQMRRAELAARRRSVAAALAVELETRRLAVEAVPLPPNVEAGVSFVSSVISLAGIDAGFRSAQADLHLLPEKLAAHVCVHYAAVQRVADFVKGQSLAAAVRMLQANRLGGHPCPDAGAMREAHVELAAAFRGVDKLIATLRALS